MVVLGVLWGSGDPADGKRAANEINVRPRKASERVPVSSSQLVHWKEN